VSPPKFLNSKNALNSEDLKLIRAAGISKQLALAIPKTTNIVSSCTDTQPSVSTASSFQRPVSAFEEYWNSSNGNSSSSNVCEKQ
jgi:hypothetical protein